MKCCKGGGHNGKGKKIRSSRLGRDHHGVEVRLADHGSGGQSAAESGSNDVLRVVQTLMAAQGRAEALKDANEAEAEIEGQAAFQTFLGSSNAYSPQ